MGWDAGVAGALSMADENDSHLGLSLSPLHSRNDQGIRFGLSASGQGRVAPVQPGPKAALTRSWPKRSSSAFGMENGLI